MATHEAFNAYFQRADADGDGRISGAEAVAFFRGANLPQPVLAKIWQFADQAQRGFLLREDFSNALKLVTVAQSGKELTPEIVRAALTGSASTQIPLPKITFAPTNPQTMAYGNRPQATASVFSSQQLRPAQAPPSQYQPQIAPQNLAGATLQNSQPRSTLGTSTQVPRAVFQGPGFQVPMQNPAVKNSSAQGGNPSPSLLIGPTTLSSASVGSLSNWSSGSNRLEGPGFQVPTQTSAVRNSSAQVGGPASSLVTGSAILSSASAGGLSNWYSGSNMGLTSISQPTAAAFSGPQGLRPPPGTGVTGAWPKMTQNDVQRYNKIFIEVDTDRDGKISGDQARGLFSSWQLPREILKHIWDLSDQDGDSMLSFREFCTALFLMERHHEGRPLPPVLPVGFHFEDQVKMQSVSAARIAEAQAAVAHHSAGHNLPAWQHNPRLLQPYGPTGGRPPLDRKPQPSKAYGENGFGSSHQLYRNGAQLNATGDQVQESENRIMSSKEKMDYYRSKLQELVLFKSRCDNRLTEYSDRAAAEKREVESLSNKYDEKFKATTEVNSRLVAEEAALQDVQGKKSELFSAITQIERGGNVNALLQTRANRILSDLDELWKALDMRAKRLGLEVEELASSEPPFGWQPGIQENAAEWEEEWEESDEEGFAPIPGMSNETDDDSVRKSKETKAKPTENDTAKDQSAPSHDSNTQQGPATVEPFTSKVTANADNDATSVNDSISSSRSKSMESNSLTAKESVLESTETGHHTNNSLVEEKSNDEIYDQAGSGSGAKDSKASSTQTLLQPKVDYTKSQISSTLSDSKGEFDFFGSFSSSKDETSASNIFSSTVNSQPDDHLFSLTAPTESLGSLSGASGRGQQTGHARFDSIASFGGDRGLPLGSFDDSDLFTSTRPLGSTAETSKASNRWSSMN